MSDNDQQDDSLSERVVKGAVDKGLESPMRESIVEAVEESDEDPSSSRRLPVVGAVLGLGAAVGYLLGVHRAGEDEETDAPEIIAEPTPDTDEAPTEAAGAEDEVEAEAEDGGQPAETETEDGGKSRLRRVLIALGIVGGAALLRRRLRSDEEDEEWEPVDEFEPAVTPEDEPTGVDTDPAEGRESIEESAGDVDEGGGDLEE